MKQYILALLLAWSLTCHGQTNLLINGSFEADFDNGLYPEDLGIFFNNHPYHWLDFWPGGDERWFIDSVWVPPIPPVPNPDFQLGYYFPNGATTFSPWSPNQNEYFEIQPAQDGLCYVGFDAKSDPINREGIQYGFDGCGLNTGEYQISFWWSRPYPNLSSMFKVRLSNESSDNYARRLIEKYTIGSNDYTPGVWYQYQKTFELRESRLKDMGNTWLSIIGKVGANANSKHYTFLDNVELYRPCDQDKRCWPATGQICPTVATQIPGAPTFLISDIENAQELELLLFVNGAQVWDTAVFNSNGLPDYYVPASVLANNYAATGRYDYVLTLRNLCGATQTAGNVTIFNGIFDTLDPWVDTTAAWSPVPIPCCLHFLLLQNTTLIGNLEYIVKDTILVANNVSATNGSNILLQAEDVIELSNVELDGSQSTVTIVNDTCAGCRLEGGGTGGQNGEVTAGAVPGWQESPESVPLPTFTATEHEVEFSVFDTETMLVSAGPNPFATTTTIAYSLSQEEHVSIQVLDHLMRPVGRLVNEIQGPGSYHVPFDSGALPSGVYFCVMATDSYRGSMSLVKIR